MIESDSAGNSVVVVYTDSEALNRVCMHVELSLSRHRSMTGIEGRVATVHWVILALHMMNLGRKPT